MATPQVINEVATAINAVISIVTGSVLKVLAVLLIMFTGWVAMDIFVGILFEDQAHTETPFFPDGSQTELQLSSNAAVDMSAASPE